MHCNTQLSVMLNKKKLSENGVQVSVDIDTQTKTEVINADVS